MADTTQANTDKTAKTIQLLWYHKLLMVAFGLAMAVVLIEFAGRRLHIIANPDAEYRAFAQQTGNLLPPYQHFTYQYAGFDGSWEFETDVRLNKFNFRGGDILTHPPKGAKRILLLGDSYTASWEVQAEDMWSTRLKNWLNQGPQRYDVVNLGFPGWGTDREYLVYRAYGRELDADVVMLIMYVENDVYDNGAWLWEGEDRLQERQRYFSLDDEGHLVEHPWMYVDHSQDYLKQPFPRNVVGWLNANSMSYRLARDVLRKGWNALVGLVNHSPKTETSASTPTPPPPPEEFPTPLECFFVPPDEKWEEAWELTRVLLQQFRADVEADGKQFIVAIIPPHMAVQTEHWRFLHFFQETERSWDLWYPHQRMLQEMEALDIPYIDATPAFVEFYAKTGLDLYYPRNRHFNPRGACVFGAVLANELSARGIVDKVPSVDIYETCQ